jgi:acyl-CoA synthetase (AMP-forming)/AMP-acid ligase II
MEGIPGKRLLNDLIDEIAILDEDRIFASIPVSDDPIDGFVDLTYGKLAVAIDRTAWWLQKAMRGRPRLETFAYLGRNDLRYPLLILAAIKTHYKASESKSSEDIPCVADICLTDPSSIRP